MNAHEIVLAVGLLGAGGLTAAAWRRTRGPELPLALALLTFWSLWGGVGLVAEGRGLLTPGRFHYLFEKMFPVFLDDAYLLTLALYGVFVAAAGLSALALWPRPAGRPPAPLHLDHARVLLVGLVCTLAGWALIRDDLAAAGDLDLNPYWALNGAFWEPTRWLTMQMVLFQAAACGAAFGVAAWIAGPRGLRIRSDRPGWALGGYLLLGGLLFGLSAWTGRKGALVTGVIAGVLFAHANVPGRGRRWLLVAGLAALFGVGTIDRLRAHHAVPEDSAWRRTVWSNEAFGPHLSLYGAIRFDVPSLEGRSFAVLGALFVPRLVWPDRPVGAYEAYAEGTDLAPGSGYTLHHAAGWYLNFGAPGVGAGGLLLGALLAGLARLAAGGGRGGPLPLRVLGAVGLATGVAALPNLVRVGIEGYKGFVLDALLIPVLAIWPAVRGRARPRN